MKKDVIKHEILCADKQTGEILAERTVYRLENGSVVVETRNDAPTKTQKHYKESTNMENIIKKYNASGIPPRLSSRVGKYVDFRDFPKNYSEVLSKLQDVEDTFNALPSEVRAKFRNSPQELINFVSDSKNKEEAIKLGLVPAPPPPQRDLAKDIAAAIKESSDSKK